MSRAVSQVTGTEREERQQETGRECYYSTTFLDDRQYDNILASVRHFCQQAEQDC